MKLSVAIVSTVAASAIVKRSENQEKLLDGEKRYAQLVDMMKHYNNAFDERKYWAYGCNCLILGK